jgi:hypothetical protein
MLGCALVLAAALCGCGGGVTAPDHLGTWYGDWGGDSLTVEVAGDVGDYRATLTYEGPFTRKLYGGANVDTFTGGKADERGYMVFKSHGDDDGLTLGPVFGGVMAVYPFDGSASTEVRR